jgi:hypothetical protein
LAKREPSIEIAFERHIAGVAASLRYDYAKRHGIRVTRIPFATKQQIKRAAHIAAVMELMQHRANEGAEIEPDKIHRLSCEHRRLLRDLGLTASTIAPPSPVKPMRPLSAALRDGDGVAS